MAFDFPIRDGRQSNGDPTSDDFNLDFSTGEEAIEHSAQPLRHPPKQPSSSYKTTTYIGSRSW
jgi:hypothetical protein